MENKTSQNILEFFNQVHFKEVFFLIAGIVLLATVVGLLHRMTLYLSKKYPARRLLLFRLSSTISFFLYVFGGLFLVYEVLHPTKELLLAIGGGMAVAIGFSLRDLVASLFAALILLFDQPFQVGDRVQFGDSYGEIKTIGLRAVRLQTLDDSQVTIPNSRFITDTVSSGNTGFLHMMIVMPFHLALDTDIRLAKDILRETVVTSRFAYMGKPVVITVAELAVGNMLTLQLTAKAYVADVKYEKEFQTDVVMRATEAFREAGIERPTLSVAHLEMLDQ
jgi:small-conductance mechanosensitive channel